MFGYVIVMLGMMLMGLIVLVIPFSLLLVYKKCPQDCVMIVSGAGGKPPYKALAQGGAMVWPLIRERNCLYKIPVSFTRELGNGRTLHASVSVSENPEILARGADKLAAADMNGLASLASRILEDVILQMGSDPGQVDEIFLAQWMEDFRNAALPALAESGLELTDLELNQS